jgi:hypothetical protein
MHRFPLLGLLMAAAVSHAAPATVDCGRLLDVKAGAWKFVMKAGVVYKQP